MDITELAITGLLKLVTDKYEFAKNTRGDEYATYDDFESRYLVHMDNNEKLEVFVSAYVRIPSNKLNIYFWLVSSYQIPLHKKYFSMLKRETDSEKHKLFFDLIFNTIQSTWSRLDFDDLQAANQELFRKYCSFYKLNFNLFYRKLRL